MERMFINPVDGVMYPESHYRMENIDLDTVIEVMDVGSEGTGVHIDISKIERMDVQAEPVFRLFAEFVLGLAEQAANTDDLEEQQILMETAAYVSRVMMAKLGNAPQVH
jgi:hypothetical protein